VITSHTLYAVLHVPVAAFGIVFVAYGAKAWCI